MRAFSFVLLLGAAGLAVGAAHTTPFTTAADVVTAVGLALFVALFVWGWPRRARRVVGRVWPWVVAAIVVGAWELVSYLASGSRAAHPTLSSMGDAVDRYWGLKAVMFFLWLWLGWALARQTRALGGHE